MSNERRPGVLPPLPTVPTVPHAPGTPGLRVEAVSFASGTHPHSLFETAVETNDAAFQLRDLEDKLNRCLATLTLHFQPIVHAADRSRFGYEALLRTGDKALPHPGAILDAAERLEKVTTLGRAVRAHAAKVITAEPAERGMFFVNLHLHDLFDKQLTSPFSPLSKIASRVVLEITERSSLEGQLDLRYRVAELRELGFQIAIDDLGGGHARMGTFSPLDTDFVKLDMSLVRDIDKHQMKQQLIRSVTQLCREQGTQVIGEGVETEAEAETLVELGCDLLQGYLIARPAPPFCDIL
ncbi:MAG TPA: EAL domain-containing protein [Kofleriaceae bacterium]|nr:EAL domain-containing protein [Kofleriaceae bacterium]